MKNLPFLFFVFSCFYLNGQRANDCGDAIVVCGNTNISSNASGFGIQELDATANPCTYEEANSLWLSVNIATGGTLAFTLRPDDTDLQVDYDFYIFGPFSNCQNLNDPIRCSTTNPEQAGLNSNLTGLSDSEIDENEGPGEEGNSFVSSIPVIAGEQYYILIDRPVGNGGFNLEWTGTSGFLPSPDVTEPKDIEVCTSTINTLIDLTEDEASITTSTTATISYYRSYEDAFDYIDAIGNPAMFLYEGGTVPIYIRVNNPNGCFEIIDFTIAPISFDNPPDLSYITCDTDRDGQADFYIADIVTDGENAIDDNTEFEWSLHANDAEAIAGSNQITDPILSSANAVIYARVSSTILADCFITYPISLTVTSPEFPAIIDLVQCDVDQDAPLDGITRINLEQAFQNAQNTNIFYYETLADRTANNAIVNPNTYSNITPFNSIVYYRAVSENCESLGEIAIVVNSTTISLNTTGSIQQCDDDSTDGVLESTFDLEGIRQNYYQGLEVAFYKNLEDVSLEQNPLEGNFKTTATTLYIRLDTNNQCQGVEEVELIVNPRPDLSLAESYQVCTDGEPLVIDAPNEFDSYNWYKIEEGQSQEIGNNQQVSIEQAGNYRLEVEIQYESNGQTSSCTSSTDFLVTSSNRATFREIEIEEVANNTFVEITVNGDGDYEFSLDAENYQDEPRFENIEAGFYTVFVRDKNGCGISEKEISVIGFPKFFTPNGDGANDTWQIIGANSNFGEKAIRIFDRYGKLVKQISTSTIGWDGSMNGQLLPSSDYWFRITLDNGKEFKGHFSLMR